MPTTAYQSAYTGTQIDDAIGAVQTAAFVGDDDGTGGVVDSSASLADLTDTNISSPTNGQALLYDTATSKWVNGAVITSETQLSKGNTSGSGNAVTEISVNNHTITLTKGSTFLTASDVVTIYSGSTAPSSSTGSNGDIYIQTS